MIEPGTARKPALANLRGIPAGGLERHLVEPRRGAHARERRAAVHRHRIVEAEGEQHGLLQPLVHDPFAAELLGGAEAAVVQAGDRRFDRVADLALGGAVDGVALFPGRIDGGLKLLAHCSLKKGRGTLFGRYAWPQWRSRSPNRCWSWSIRPSWMCCCWSGPDKAGMWQSVTGSREPEDRRPGRDRPARAAGGDRPVAGHAHRLAAQEPLRDLAAMARPLCARRHAQCRACVRLPRAADHGRDPRSRRAHRAALAAVAGSDGQGLLAHQPRRHLAVAEESSGMTPSRKHRSSASSAGRCSTGRTSRSSRWSRPSSSRPTSPT